MKLNVDELRTGFPSLHQMVNGHKLVYFDMPYRDWETDRKSTRLNSSH